MPGSAPHAKEAASALMAHQREADIAQMDRLLCGTVTSRDSGKGVGQEGHCSLGQGQSAGMFYLGDPEVWFGVALLGSDC